MADYSGVSTAVLAGAGRTVARLGAPRARLMFEWRSEEDLALERMRLAGFLAGRTLDDAQARSALDEIDRFLMDAAMAMMRR